MQACGPEAAIVLYPTSFPSSRARRLKMPSTSRSLLASLSLRITSSKPRLVEAIAADSSRISCASLIRRISERAAANCRSRSFCSGSNRSTSGAKFRNSLHGLVAAPRIEIAGQVVEIRPRPEAVIGVIGTDLLVSGGDDQRFARKQLRERAPARPKRFLAAQLGQLGWQRLPVFEHEFQQRGRRQRVMRRRFGLGL